MTLPWPNSTHGDRVISAKCRSTARFRATFICDALETDWPVGAAGFEPPHSGIEIRQDSSLGLRDSNLCILKLDLLNFISPLALPILNFGAASGRAGQRVGS